MMRNDPLQAGCWLCYLLGVTDGHHGVGLEAKLATAYVWG